MEIKKQLIPKEKWDLKCPYPMTAEYITVHNTANDASALNEITYMAKNNNKTSYHIAVDDVEAIQAIPFDRNAWHAGDGNGKGNRKSIAIEICYSKSGGYRFEQAEKNAVKLIAQLLKERKWGIDRVKKHQDFSGKYCPHKTLDLGWNRFVKIVENELNVKENIIRQDINFDGVKATVDAIEKEGRTYIKTSDLTKLGLDVEYCEETKEIELSSVVQDVQVLYHRKNINIKSRNIKDRNFFISTDLEKLGLDVGYENGKIIINNRKEGVWKY